MDGWAGLELTCSEKKGYQEIQDLWRARQSSRQEEEETSQRKLCGKGPGWAWITPTWEARIKTSDLSSRALGPLAWFTLGKPSCFAALSGGDVQRKFYQL